METYKNGIWHGMVVRRVHSCMHGFPPKGAFLFNLGCGAGRFICNIVILTSVRFASGVCILLFSVRGTHIIHYTSLLLLHKPSLVRPWCVFSEHVHVLSAFAAREGFDVTKHVFSLDRWRDEHSQH
jgi:hypothetical protein